MRSTTRWRQWPVAVEARKGIAVTFMAALVLLAGCGGDDAVTNPTEVTLGETTFVFLLNPVVNDVNQKVVPPPGDAKSGVDVMVLDGPSASTDGGGVGVLAPVDEGTRSVSFNDGSNNGNLSLDITAQDLLEVAVALGPGGAAEMANVEYAFGGSVVTITPDMSIEDVNDALSQSNSIVLVEGGVFTGNVEFSGSNVTLFGEGPKGGNVTIDGNAVVSGSQNRLRGVRITGDLSVPGSNAGISFSSVVGALTVDGSDARLLANEFCGGSTIIGGGLLALGNAGMDPVPPPSGGC